MANIFATIDKTHFKTELTTPTGNIIIADEPIDIGGQDLGFSPSELLAASLGTCTCVTLRMYADRKGWEMIDVKVEVDFTRDAEKNISHIIRKIELIGNLTDEQRQRLLTVANSCFIHKTLTNPIEVTTALK